MKRLFVDYLERNKWYILGFGGYFILLYCVMFLVAEDRARGIDPRIINSFFLVYVLGGGSIIRGRDMKLGVSRVTQTLPLSAREVAVASWMTWVPTVSLMVAIVIALSLCVTFVFGRTSGADFQLVPLALAWSAAISGTLYLCWMRLRKLFIPLYAGLAALAVLYGPSIHAPWTGFQVPHVLMLSLGLTLAGVSLSLTPRAAGRNLIIGQAQPGTSLLSGARDKGERGAGMPSVLPSRRVGMASPWLRTFGFSCKGLLAVIPGVIYIFVVMGLISGGLSRMGAFLDKREPVVQIAFLLSAVSITLSAISYSGWMFSLRALRALPLSASRLAFLQMAFPLAASLPCWLAMLPALIVFKGEATLLAVLILLTGAGCASLCCALAIRFNVPLLVFSGVVIGNVFASLNVFISVYRSEASAITDLANSTLIKASLFAAALVLMIVGFFLFRQAIASASRPYRSIPMLAERMPGGR